MRAISSIVLIILLLFAFAGCKSVPVDNMELPSKLLLGEYPDPDKWISVGARQKAGYDGEPLHSLNANMEGKKYTFGLEITPEIKKGTIAFSVITASLGYEHFKASFTLQGTTETRCLKDQSIEFYYAPVYKFYEIEYDGIKYICKEPTNAFMWGRKLYDKDGIEFYDSMKSASTREGSGPATIENGAQVPERTTTEEMREWYEDIDKYTRIINSGKLTGDYLADAYNKRGFAYTKVGDFAEALNDAEKAISKSKLEYADAYNTKGIALLYGQNNREEAIVWFNRAIEYAPSKGAKKTYQENLELALRWDRQ